MNSRNYRHQRTYHPLVSGLVKAALVSAALILGGKGIEHIVDHKMDEIHLTAQDFDNAKWMKALPGMSLYSSYMVESIPHNQHNYDLYLKEVRERNKGNLNGGFVLEPDLDNNGYVGGGIENSTIPTSQPASR